MSRKRPVEPERRAAPASESGASRVSEWLTVVVLLAMALALLWINLSLRRRDAADARAEFDLKNPLLDARDHECVEVYAEAAPRDAACVSVLPGGLVLRPADGPDRFGDQDDLRHAPPYLAAQSRQAAPGSGGCRAGRFAGPPEHVIYPLNGFGLPRDRLVRVDSVEPVLAKLGGLERRVYLAVLEDAAGVTWKCYLSPDAPLTGLYRFERLPQGPGVRADGTSFTPVQDCP